MKTRIYAAIAFSILFIVSSAQAVFLYAPLPAPPKADEIGEVIFERSDWSNNSEYVQMTRQEFLQFFKRGVFHNDGDTSALVYRTKHFPEPLNAKGGWRYCTGAFATKTGQVFFWNRPREGVLEIEDHQHRTGWLVLPEYLKKQSIALVLKAVNQTMKQGAIPNFTLTITNQGKASEQVINLGGGRRRDLQDAYCVLEIVQNDKPVSLPRAVSDPGPISDEDFLTLKPGASVTFNLTKFAIALEKLSPGKYKARVRFWQDPRALESIVLSPYAEFAIQK